jgi:CubicO group peptidase (beta-lactamase class C family)
MADGTVAPGYEAVRAAFAKGQEPDEGGAQLCVYRHGVKVVDLWTGRDRANNRPFGEDTITMIMSCTKGAVAICANILAERGLIDVEAPVARYWPEFASGGKAGVTVAHLLTHSAGLLGFDPDIGFAYPDLLDSALCTQRLAEMAPLWAPGSAYAYHFVTYGFLVGEVIRRVSGKSVGRFFADEVAKPLGLDFWIGLPEEQERRVAPHFRDTPDLTTEQWRVLFKDFGDSESRLARCLIETFTTTDAFLKAANSRRAHAIELAAGNGITNARSLARMYAACIGSVEGVRLLGAAAMERARTLRTATLPLPGVFAAFAGNRVPQQFGLGFELPRPVEPMLGPGSFGHAGAGGRMGFAHPESGFAVGYVCNNMLWDGARGPDSRWQPWTEALLQLQ